MKQRLGLCIVFVLGACGTAYDLPKVNAQDHAKARLVASQEATRGAPSGVTTEQFWRTARRVEYVSELFCAEHIQRNATCDVSIRIDRDPNLPPNAYQYYENGRPVLEFTEAMLAKMDNDDEVAFVLGHEMGHHIADHIGKGQQQALAGAIVGAVAGAAVGAHNDWSPYNRTDAVEAGLVLGTVGGQAAYRQTYELEADMLGAYIAEAAGYNAERGAALFQRREPGETRSGARTFWSTHPPDAQRVALVSATVRQIRAQGRDPVLVQ